MPKTVTVESPFASRTITVTPSIEAKPNVLLLIVDDFSLDCLRSYNAFHGSHFGYTLGSNPTTFGGTGAPQTDEFASIATAGVRFTHAFGYPNCSPTRSCIYTARYGVRTGIGTVIGEAQAGSLGEFSDTFSREVAIHRWLQPAGYRTLVCGKWHMALPTEDMDPDPGATGELGWLHPTAPTVGVGTFRGTFRNLNKPPLPPDGNISGDTIKPGYWNFYWYESDDPETYPPLAKTSYVTTWQRQRIQNWITNAGKTIEPWLVVWAASAAHSPFGPRDHATNSGCMPPDDSSHVYNVGVYDENTIWGSTRAAIECIDKQLGTLRTNLGTAVWDRTWVFVVADNGTDGAIIEGTTGAVDEGQNFGGYLMANTGRFKQSVYASGTRLALLVKGPAASTGMPGIISPNRTSHAFVDAVDIGETIRQITYADKFDAITDDRGIDGISFYPILRNQPAAHTRSYSFSEVFTPNGLPGEAIDTTLGHRKDRCYRKTRADGKWSLVRRLSGTSTIDELYHLTDVNDANVDSVEATNLASSQTTIRDELRADLQAHLETMSGDQGA